MTPEEYKLLREEEIEQLAKQKLIAQLSLSENQVIPVQQDKQVRDLLYSKLGITTKKTPDFAISDGTEKSPSDLMLVEISEPTGGSYQKHGISAQIAQSMGNAPLSNGMDGNVQRVLLNPPSINIDEEITNKIRKAYSKYSFHRCEKKHSIY
ncbi:hypothetical protein [Photobacterium leiognathi]|uniref:hypothetical protein n=1 Tax=Photobacterium leiognathi TaxID=553611 RepID=UPI0027325605|nr:hypothetical protein [Photobacterium leiognathi]